MHDLPIATTLCARHPRYLAVVQRQDIVEQKGEKMGSVLRAVGQVAGVVSTVAAAVGLPQIAMAAALISPSSDVSSQIRESPMTAINLFQDGFRAYIATDGAYFCPKTGSILGMGSKTVMFPSVNMAIAISGRMLPNDLVKSLDQVCDQLGQHAILKALPDALRVMSGSYGKQNWENARLWIATYDKVRAKPRLYAIASDFDPSAPEAEPMTLREISGWTTGLTPVQLSQVLPKGYVTNPRGDACRLLAAQRHHKFEQAGGKHCVAGTCEMYTISRKGVIAERILSFPEKVGELVDPALPGRLLDA